MRCPAALHRPSLEVRTRAYDLVAKASLTMMSRQRRRAFRFRKSRLLREATPRMPKLPNSLAASRERSPSPATNTSPTDWSAPTHRAQAGGTWESDAPQESAAQARPEMDSASPTAQVLSLFADPRVSSIDAAFAAKELSLPRQDVQNILGALTQAGYLSRNGEMSESFSLSPDKKTELEQLYMGTLQQLHQEQGLVHNPGQEPFHPALQAQEDDPRMPMTAGILSLFLPGTGQLLNGDIGRAVLVFAIWALAILAPHPAIIIFVRLYAGAEAFFNAKLRRLAQRRALEAAAEQRAALGAATPALPAPGVGS